ncbi:hypothetical protein AAF712_016427 [Marasmius tenuissimus]|uniref:AAA-ATPase-like domain-containing protein n=2 Tax=Marasmius tenuissimus TaxID=585030 RepID=A0ABR2Z6R3_9AGAR
MPPMPSSTHEPTHHRVDISISSEGLVDDIGHCNHSRCQGEILLHCGELDFPLDKDASGSVTVGSESVHESPPSAFDEEEDGITSSESSSSNSSDGSGLAPTPSEVDLVKLVRGMVHVAQRIAPKRVPLGRVPFYELVTCPGMLFVDKTKALQLLSYYLAPSGINVFRRPHGYGLRTMAEMVAGFYDWNYDKEPEIFSRLAVGRQYWTLKPDDRFRCVVLRLDFSDYNPKLAQAKDLREALWSYIRSQVEDILDIYEPLFHVDRPVLDMEHLSFVTLANFLRQTLRASNPLYVVVQNYDGLRLPFDEKEIASVLTDVYTDLSDAAWGGYVRVLLTGYAQAGAQLDRKHTPLFSSTSIYYEDLSTHPAFRSLCGFTEAEIRDYEIAMQPSLFPYFKSRPIMDNLRQLGDIRPVCFFDKRLWLGRPGVGTEIILPPDGEVYPQTIILGHLATRSKDQEWD